MFKITLLLISISFSTQLFALIGGEVAKTGEGAGVLQIVVQDNKDANINNQCTATKIREDVLLTAAHCFEHIQERSSILGFTTKIDNSDFDFEGVEISKVVIHPTYVLDNEDENQDSSNEESLLGTDEDEMGSDQIDMAIVFLKPGTSFGNITAREIDYEFVNPDASVEIWGYGCQKSTNSTDDYLPLKKHGKSKTLDQVVLRKNYGRLTRAVHNEANIIYQNNILTAGLNIDSKSSSVCFGDSGGPLFKDGKLVGVNTTYLAKGMDQNGKSPSGKTDVNLHQRLSVVKDWLKEELSKEK
jgi:secreted trypsin-like serine protease